MSGFPGAEGLGETGPEGVAGTPAIGGVGGLRRPWEGAGGWRNVWMRERVS